jgi:hypothetical protein
VFTDEEEANPTSSDVQEVGAVAEPELLNVKVKKTKKRKAVTVLKYRTVKRDR